MPHPSPRDPRSAPAPCGRFVALRSAVAKALRPASFGADPVGERLERIRRSPNFSHGAFRNPVPTRTMLPGAALPLLRAVLRRADRVRRSPATAVPLHHPSAAELSTSPASGLRLRWIGHSSVLADIDGHRVLFDPVWGKRCSPFTFIGPRRLHPVPVPLGEVGSLDAVVISHDHYDHLDMPAIRALVHSGALFTVPLGVGAHLERWGVPTRRIVELDWNESAKVAGLKLTAAQARHFCGRGLRNGMRTLWASWVVAGPRHRVFHSGDTGYFPGFAKIGAAHGPFDATMMQIGAYSELWPEVHMTPEDGVRAHTDLMGGTLLPIHWGTFSLAPHPWEEPAERTVAAARAAGVKLATLRPGEAFEPGAEPPLTLWWRSVAVPPKGGWPVGGWADDERCSAAPLGPEATTGGTESVTGAGPAAPFGSPGAGAPSGTETG